jgi:hypothetical protein
VAQLARPLAKSLASKTGGGWVDKIPPPPPISLIFFKCMIISYYRNLQYYFIFIGKKLDPGSEAGMTQENE